MKARAIGAPRPQPKSDGPCLVCLKARLQGGPSNSSLGVNPIPEREEGSAKSHEVYLQHNPREEVPGTQMRLWPVPSPNEAGEEAGSQESQTCTVSR